MTAINWLEKELSVQYPRTGMFKTIYELVEEAKEMEKQQIMKAVYDSMGTNFDPNMGRAEQYYYKIYGK